MIRNDWILSAALGASLLCGCGDPKESASTSDASADHTASVPATQPVPVADAATSATAAMKPPATQPVVVTSTFRLFERGTPDDLGMLYEFPRARLHINQSDNTAVLYSDDPKAAIKPTYGGNSYYMVIPLDKDQPLRLDGYQWQFKSGSIDDHRDSADGIFIDGQRYHLQASDVTVAFQGQGQEVKVAVIGQFSKFDTMANQAQPIGSAVFLKGIVVAKVDSEK
ncbi:MAG TPA: hypothetical protein VG326_02180 [Tepidisphaeraceae bacterium]|jgi:hypothetical protein|nr:hypothetical protein [Tepidisphaeraceae bacterium]